MVLCVCTHAEHSAPIWKLQERLGSHLGACENLHIGPEDLAATPEGSLKFNIEPTCLKKGYGKGLFLTSISFFEQRSPYLNFVQDTHSFLTYLFIDCKGKMEKCSLFLWCILADYLVYFVCKIYII